jgi:putative ABC transport system permease protein
MADTSGRRAGWALRREYRSTYRDSIVGSEVLVAGTWFADAATRAKARAANPDAPFEVSLEQNLATDLGVVLGDTVTWNVQGVPITTVVTSFRTVNFARTGSLLTTCSCTKLRTRPSSIVKAAPGGRMTLASNGARRDTDRANTKQPSKNKNA